MPRKKKSHPPRYEDLSPPSYGHYSSPEEMKLELEYRHNLAIFQTNLQGFMEVVQDYPNPDTPAATRILQRMDRIVVQMLEEDLDPRVAETVLRMMELPAVRVIFEYSGMKDNFIDILQEYSLHLGQGN
jgi:hypothetical protein